MRRMAYHSARRTLTGFGSNIRCPKCQRVATLGGGYEPSVENWPNVTVASRQGAIEPFRMVVFRCKICKYPFSGAMEPFGGPSVYMWQEDWKA